MQFEANRCPRCGTFPEEWLDEEGRMLEPPPYIPLATRCYGDVALDEENELAKKHDSKGGLHIRLVPNREGVSRWREDPEDAE